MRWGTNVDQGLPVRLLDEDVDLRNMFIYMTDRRDDGCKRKNLSVNYLTRIQTHTAELYKLLSTDANPMVFLVNR